jgi:hypothetical protein
MGTRVVVSLATAGRTDGARRTAAGALLLLSGHGRTDGGVVLLLVGHGASQQSLLAAAPPRRPRSQPALLLLLFKRVLITLDRLRTSAKAGFRKARG